MTDHPGIQEKADFGAVGKSLLARIDSFAPDDPPPHRAVRLVLDVDADDVEELCRVLDEIADEMMDHCNYIGWTSGGVASGHHLEIARREVTHDEWWAELQAWRQRRHSTPVPEEQ